MKRPRAQTVLGRKPSKHSAKPKAKPQPQRRSKRKAQTQAEQVKQFSDNSMTREDKKLTVGFRVTRRMLDDAMLDRPKALKLARQVFALAKPMPGVVPKGASVAMDEAIETAIGWAANSIFNGAFAQGVTFMGYPYLAELAQRAEYRRISEIIATEMTREWIEIKAKGDDAKSELEDAKAKLAAGQEKPQDAESDQPPALAGDLAPFEKKDAAAEAGPGGQEGASLDKDDAPSALKQDEGKQELKKLAARQAKDKRVLELEKEFERLKVRDCFRKMAEMDGYFGRGHLFIDTEQTDEGTELSTAIGDGQNKISQYKLGKGSIKRFQPVEPIWTYPTAYNAINPLKSTWYKPETWYVMGKEVHATRLLTFIGREVPDLLKPAYSFGGLSLSQLAKECVDNWLKTRSNVSNLIEAFSVMILATNMGTAMQEGESNVRARAEMYAITRNNRDLVIIDKDSEELSNVSAPLGSLDSLQAQSQEHICSVTGIPLVKYTGISPTGLNATSEFEMQAFYEWIAAFQQALFAANLTKVFHMLQVNLWGKVDPDLSYEFKTLYSLNEKEEAERQKSDADRDKTYIDAGVLDPTEVRQRLSEDSDGPYAGIPPEDAPEPPEPEMPFGAGGEEEGGEADGKNDPETASPEV